MTLAFLLQAVNMLAFSHYTTPELVVFGSAFTGLCYGTIFTLMPAATADFYGIRNLGVNYGLVFTAFGVAGVVGPLLGAGINDHFKSYFYAYQISAGMLVLGAVLAMLTKPPGTRATPAAPQPDVSLREPILQQLKPKPNPMNPTRLLTTLALAGSLALSHAQSTMSTAAATPRAGPRPERPGTNHPGHQEPGSLADLGRRFADAQ